jgi:hypothetical protein
VIGAGRLLVAIGAAIALLGLILWGLGKAGFRGLPGDIRYESDNVRIYFPIVTCIAVSVVLTLALWLWHWLSRK